ncbi:ABC transporter substrate-binding protein [Nocardia sp. NPDC006044]|uniref:ABC transporter substrate-binding protein n=1 Tax=Nocardia sp. NPDC006044 TaxID=3364306 RepID=UPI0036AFDA9D
MKKQSKTALAAAALAVALSVTSCNANPTDGAGNTTQSVPPQKGGTLRILSSNTDFNFDPAKSTNLAITSLSLIARRLTTWQAEPGKEMTPIPDLATDTGTTTDGGRTWKYTLKDDLKFQDGSPITSADIKYGLERSFAPLLSGGFTYHRTLLQGGEAYDGPYAGKSLDSIETPDAKTLIFHLNKPFGDFPWIASQPAFTPVPKAKDNPATYFQSPVASGPYQVEKFDKASEVVLVRNPNWDPKTDTARTAGPDRVIFQLGMQQTTISQELIADTGTAKSAFSASFVPASQLPLVRSNPSAKNRIAEAGGGSLYQLQLNVSKAPLNDPKVRQAIVYATDKQAFRTSLGGESRGDYATTNIPPAIPGYQKFDAFPTQPTGDVEKAKQLLAESGHPNGIDLVLVTKNDATNSAGGQAIEAGLRRAGIRVTIQALDNASFDDITQHKDGSGYDLALASWQADFPSAASMLQPSFGSSEIGNGGFNVSRYSNPRVDDLIAKATAEVDPKRAGELWLEVDRIVTGDAANVPLVNSVNTFIFGSDVRNFYVPPFPAYPVYFKVSLAQ